LQVSFLENQAYTGVSGLSRYERSLILALREFPTLTVRSAPIPPPPLPTSLLTVIRRVGYDLIAFHQDYPLRWPQSVTGLVHLTRLGQATLLLRKGRRHVVVTVHDIIHFMHRRDPTLHIYKHPIQAWFDALAVRMLKRADVVLASSNYTKRCLIEYAEVPADKIRVIYLGIDSERFYPHQVPTEFYRRYKLDPKIPYILHLSTEEPRKNIPRLLRAFASVHEKYPRAVLLKIGRPLYPTQRQHHLNLVQRLDLAARVRFVDDVPDEDLPYFYSASRVFVLPSTEEGFGFPVLEAMACGIPVICSRVASLPEIAGEASLLIDPYKTDDIVEAIIRLLTNERLSTELSIKGMTQAKQFSWENTASQTVDIYKNIIENNNAA
jgi:glycosyltransferase involved in cell wall biosynthesis